MMRILICDDDRAQLEALRGHVRDILDRVGLSAMIRTFGEQAEIPAHCYEDCSIALLDIDFREQSYNGLDIAKRLRQVNREAVIIFITNYVEYAPEGYEVQAFRYLMKSELEPKLEGYLLQAVARLQEVRRTLTVTVSAEPVTLLLSDILYIESQAHTAVIHSRKGELRVYASLKSLEAQLSKQGFLRIQKSFLVNMERVKRFQSTGAELDEGTVLPVSPKTYARQKAQYLLWKGSR